MLSNLASILSLEPISKFCKECGALIRMVTDGSDIALPEPCPDCRAQLAVIESATAAIAKQQARCDAAKERLEEIKEDRKVAFERTSMMN